MVKMKKTFWYIVITTVAIVLTFEPVLAATSTANNNFRIFEDTTWLIAFTLMIVTGLTLSDSGGRGLKLGFILLALTGLSGWFWKGIGLIKRILSFNEPEWFFSLTRETFEGLTGVLLGISLLIIVFSIHKIYDK